MAGLFHYGLDALGEPLQIALQFLQQAGSALFFIRVQTQPLALLPGLLRTPAAAG